MVEEKDMPVTRFDKGSVFASFYRIFSLNDTIHSFLLNMMSFPEMIRNVAVVGHLHHGKTALMDMLVFETHQLNWDADKPVSNAYILAFSS